MPVPANKNKRCAAFTLPELLMGLGILAILVTLVLVVVPGMLRVSRSMRCVANLKALHAATMLYAADHSGEIPPVDRANESTGSSWYIPLLPYLNLTTAAYNNPKTCLTCPERKAGNSGWTNYAVNYKYYFEAFNMLSVPAGSSKEEKAAFLAARKSARMSRVVSNKILYLDSRGETGGTWYQTSPTKQESSWVNIHAVHGDRVNVIFLDGHVQSPKVAPREFKDGSLNELKLEWFGPVVE